MHKLHTRRIADFAFWTVWLFASTALVARFAMEFLV